MTFASAPSRALTTSRRVMAGNTLLIVVVLLLLATLFVTFALNVGRFEQRTSGNDLRAKIAHEVAESGVSLGVEFLNARRPIVADEAFWRLCASDETTFPCGAVPEARRGTMYTYMNGSDGFSLADRLLPIDAALASTPAGGFSASREVGAVLCRVAPIPAAGGPATCATDIASASTTWLVTVVSKGSLIDEGSSATVTQTVGAYNLLSFGPNIPPVVASGSVSVGGGLQIVTSSDAAGPGVPVSVWTRLEMSKTGTPNTCYMEEFLRQGGTSTGPTYYQDTAVCHTCSCPATGSLSYPKSGGQACQGMDILDIDDNAGNDCDTDPNLDIPREEFPEDLFAMLFGQKAWRDVDRDGIAAGAPCTYAAQDCHFAEERIISPCTYPDPATGAPINATLPVDTCFLLNIKNKIHIGDGLNDDAECAAIGPATNGVVWVHSQAFAGLPGNADCADILKNVDQIGTPKNPVLLIFDGVLTNVHFQLYGLVFMREPNDTTTMTASTGGSAGLELNAGATIYGAVVVQGQLSKGVGNAAVVYNKDVLLNLINDPDNINPAGMPGSWTDRLRY